MIELIQVPYSPFCIAQRRILEFSGAPFKITNIPNGDRSLVWKLSGQSHYQVPLLRDGKRVVAETDDNSQVIAKYLDAKLRLGLFPPDLEGLQSVLWRYIENEIEDLTFRLNDAYYEQNVPPKDRLNFVRHKERKFGRGCLAQWKADQTALLARLEEKLRPCEQMLAHRPFLLDERPRFVDFDLFGMLGNFLFTGNYELPASQPHLVEWRLRMSKLKLSSVDREKLHS